MRYSIRSMNENDIPQVTEIDREAFPTQWPYPAYAYKRELNNSLATYIVATEAGSTWHNRKGNRRTSLFQPLLRLFRHSDPVPDNAHPAPECIAGFAGVWRMVDEAHLTTIAVRNCRRRQGIGELLLISVIDMAVDFQATVVTLEVRMSNSSAQTLYRKYGFNDAGLRKGYYSEDGEDALIMTTDDIHSEKYRAIFDPLKKEHLHRMAEREAIERVTAPARAN